MEKDRTDYISRQKIVETHTFWMRISAIEPVRKMLVKRTKSDRSPEPPRIPHRRPAGKLAAQILSPRERYGYIIANTLLFVKFIMECE